MISIRDMRWYSGFKEYHQVSDSEKTASVYWLK